MPVIQHYENLGTVCLKISWHCFLIHLICRIDSSSAVDEVHAAAVAAVEKVLV